MKRTATCGELSLSDLGKKVTIEGWLNSIRDIGSMAFFTVRDFYGITQCITSDEKILKKLREIQRESTISVTGKVIKRNDANPNMPTGEIEIAPEFVDILGRCTELLPFEIKNSDMAREDLRLKYRFLDLRNETNKNKIVLRSRIIKYIRDLMYEQGFLEIQTPILTASSPEGARDYLVPSRVHPGQFYALPQAPQQFKQLLMTSGFDKYFQIAPCFRDEDARADRSPGEFYQLDLEMAFASQEDVFKVMEEVLPKVFSKFSNNKIAEVPFPRIAYKDAMELYGSDKPDLRNPLVIKNITHVIQELKVPFFENKTVKAIVVNGAKESRNNIEAIAKKHSENGAIISWARYEDARFGGALSKFFNEDNSSKIAQELNLKNGALIYFIAGSDINKTAGLLRTEVGTKFNLIEKNVFKFCWIVDFPMFEFNEEENKIDFSHNPFSMPQGGMNALKSKNPLDILAYQYDIVCNGIELSSGAVRNHDPEIMIKAFEIAGYSEQVVENKFSALFNAFKFGAPPHAGIAPGVDRMIMLIADEPNIREIIAFPMNKNARDLLMNAPLGVSEKQLQDVHISIKLPKN